jgi:hypothetical protein
LLIPARPGEVDAIGTAAVAVKVSTVVHAGADAVTVAVTTTGAAGVVDEVGVTFEGPVVKLVEGVVDLVEELVFKTVEDVVVESVEDDVVEMVEEAVTKTVEEMVFNTVEAIVVKIVARVVGTIVGVRDVRVCDVDVRDLADRLVELVGPLSEDTPVDESGSSGSSDQRAPPIMK